MSKTNICTKNNYHCAIKNGNVGFWTSFSYNSRFDKSGISGEGWTGLWPRNMTNHGQQFNSIFDVINDQYKVNQSFEAFNNAMSFWEEPKINNYISPSQNEDISFGIGIATSMIGEATNIPTPPKWCKLLGRTFNTAGSLYGIYDNSESAIKAFNQGHYFEATFQAYQVYGYGATTIMLQIPLTIPFATPVLLWMTALDIGEYYLKHYLNKRQ